MPLTLEQMETQGILKKLADDFYNDTAAGTLLAKIGVEKSDFKPFGEPSVKEWWREACRRLESGIAESDILDRLLAAAADSFPGSKEYHPFIKPESLPENRKNPEGNIKVKITQPLNTDDTIKILKALQEMAMETGFNIDFNYGNQGSSIFSLSIKGVHSRKESERLAEQIESKLAEEDLDAHVHVESHTFRDYYADPITVEGPDGQRFGLDQIPASTPVKDIARGVMHQYGDDVWPAREGQKTQAVVDKITGAGTSDRLDPRQTLHDAGVRPGDTLRVAPERTAGAIDPLMHEAALSRVRNETLGFAESHPGFEVQANSLVAPTEYLFQFQTKGFAPPATPGGAPRVIHEHEVLVELPADFPIQAPEAWWQTDIFHPNIDPHTGWVCLGALQEQYRPSLDFGELCQMLFDLAGYRNYAVTEGHNMDAARWALSEEGQLAIEAIGGLSVVGRMVMEGRPEQNIKIRKLQS